MENKKSNVYDGKKYKAIKRDVKKTKNNGKTINEKHASRLKLTTSKNKN